ncbi:MAG: PQQ-binding-like beta-propeller repeat protein, partial [Candidatus Sericytochromatia bacterium]
MHKSWHRWATLIFLLSGCAGWQPVPEQDPGDWPTFQGSQAHGGSRQVRPITHPRVRWKQRIGIQSWLNNPIVVGQRVFVSSSGPDPDFGQNEKAGIYALDLKSGAVQWQHETDWETNGVSYASGLILASGEDGDLRALTADNGTLR